MSAKAFARQKGRRRNLLNSYAEKYGDALRRSQSTVALKAARVDAELAYRARGSFLASMNHELRTPLNAIIGFTELLKQADMMGMTAEKRDEYLDYVLQSADLLLSHIDTIIQIADAESGGSKLSRRAFDIGDVIRQIIDEADVKDENTKAEIQLDAPRDVPPVNADPDKIAIAFRHILDFLKSGTEEAFHIDLTIRPGLAGKSAGYVYIALECRPAIFTQDEIKDSLRVFERVHEGLDRKFDSARLGLPIAKSYVELNQGKFSVKSVEGKATLVRFALPVAQSEHQTTYERLAS